MNRDRYSLLASLWKFLLALVGAKPATAPPAAPSTPTPPVVTPTPPPRDEAPLTPLTPRVLVIHFDGIVEPSGGIRLSRHPVAQRWHKVDDLIAGYIADVAECSGGLVQYRVVEKIVVDQFPIKEDGFRYDGPGYLHAIRTGDFHQPNGCDYDAIIHDFDLIGRVQRDEIDEVWLFGGPYDGYYESLMVGAGAFWINGPAIQADCRRFAIMGFNCERGVGEMLEDLGHRAEAVLGRIFNVLDVVGWAYDRNRDPTRYDLARLARENLFVRFLLYDQIAPQQANVGLLHFAPNSVQDYDWGNPTPVRSCADDWLLFPTLPDPPNYRLMTALDWGGGDIRRHHKWWFQRLPKAAGRMHGLRNNWWAYICNLANPEFDM